LIQKAKIAEFAQTAVEQYTMCNKNGMELSILNYGGVVRRLVFADKTGKKRIASCVIKILGCMKKIRCSLVL